MERESDFYLEDSHEYTFDLPQDDALPVLFRHDFEPGASTNALLARVAELSAAGQRVVVLFDRAALADRPERLELLAQLPDEVQRLVRSGPHLVSVEERWNINQFNRSHRFSGSEQENAFRPAYRRDFHRATGQAAFFAVVQVSDLDPVGVALLGSTISESARRILVSPATVAASGGTPDAAPLAWYEAVASSTAEIDLGFG